MPQPSREVYLDNHSTTQVDPRVVEAMLPYFVEDYGNPSASGHGFGRRAALAVETARERVASLIGAEPREVIFTSGATEANNLAIKGIAASLKRKGDHLVSSAIEHKAVLDPLRRLTREGWRLSLARLDPTGYVSAEAVAEALTERSALVSIMAANNEVGTINDLEGIGRLCRERDIVFHSDATQAVGKIPFDVRTLNLDLVSFTAHKLHGPKGVGALWARDCQTNPRLSPLFDGGGQERGLRSGTLAVPLIVGFGKAAEIAAAERENEADRLRSFRDTLLAGFTALGLDFQRNGHPHLGLPGNLNISVNGVNGDRLHALLARGGLAVSSGAACGSGFAKSSHVLQALGISEAQARASLRFGLGRFTTLDDIEFALETTWKAVQEARGVEKTPGLFSGQTDSSPSHGN